MQQQPPNLPIFVSPYQKQYLPQSQRGSQGISQLNLARRGPAQSSCQTRGHGGERGAAARQATLAATAADLHAEKV